MAIRFIISAALGKTKARRKAEAFTGSLASSLGEPVSADVAESYSDLYQKLTAGQADFGWCPAVVCFKLVDQTRSLFASVREGKSCYHAVLVGRQDRRLSLDKLSGSRAAWVDPLSFGGYLLAIEFLKRRRIDPDRTFSSQKFYGSYPDAASAVLEGKADLTSVVTSRANNDSIRRVLSQVVGTAFTRLSIIGVTDPIPADGLVIMRGMDESIAERLEQLIENSHRHDELCNMMNCEGFNRTQPVDYKVVALTRCLSLIPDFTR